MKPLLTAKRLIIIPSLTAAVILLDQAIKLLVRGKLPLWEATRTFAGFRLHHTQNTGAAFSFLRGHPQVLTVVVGVILLAAIIYLFTEIKKRPYSQSVCLALICGGGIGNLIDRLCFGYVVDYIEPVFIRFAIFNFADIVLTCSVAVWAFLLFRETGKAARSD
jgi:signal peptidase II